jgi:hypothetical protein
MQSSFGGALSRLWPSGDTKIPGLRAGMIASAPLIFAKYGINTPLLAAHVMAQRLADGSCAGASGALFILQGEFNSVP